MGAQWSGRARRLAAQRLGVSRPALSLRSRPEPHHSHLVGPHVETPEQRRQGARHGAQPAAEQPDSRLGRVQRRAGLRRGRAAVQHEEQQPQRRGRRQQAASKNSRRQWLLGGALEGPAKQWPQRRRPPRGLLGVPRARPPGGAQPPPAVRWGGFSRAACSSEYQPQQQRHAQQARPAQRQAWRRAWQQSTPETPPRARSARASETRRAVPRSRAAMRGGGWRRR